MTQSPHEIYGHRTMTHIIDEKAKTDPDEKYAIIPSSDSFSTPPRDITFAILANAINRAAWWLEKTLGKPSERKIIAWVGPQDLRYPIFSFAADKVGYGLLLPSPRNSVAFHLHIFKTAKCNTVLRDEQNSFDHVTKENPEIKDIVAPGVDFFLNEEPVDEYKYTETEASFHQPFLIIHSSGSTGMPKIIIWTHASLATMDRQHLLGLTGHTIGQLESFPPGNAFVAFPLFHAGGILLALGWGIFYQHTVIFPPPGQMKALTVMDALAHVVISTLASPPSILEELTQVPGGLDQLKNVREVLFGGGPLSDDRAKMIAKVTDVYSMIGSSESASFPITAHGAEDVGYISFPTELKGLQFRDNGAGLYELVFVRDPETDEFHSTWETFPELQEYSTKDLYSKHPTKDGLFHYEGRNDDVLVLSNGEKVVTLPLEGILKGAPGVTEAIVIGQGRFEIAALLELTEEAQKLSKEEFFKSIDSSIKSGNKIMPKFAKLSTENIIFTSPEKPLIRTPKGTVVRTKCLQLYKDEIDDIYRASAAVDASKYPLLSTDDISTTLSSLITIYGEIVDFQVDADTDVFVRGFDSLGVMTAVRKIKAIIDSEKKDVAQLVTPSLLYSNPTLKQLADALHNLSPGAKVDDRSQAVQLFEDFIEDIPETKISTPPTSDKFNVVLTGSTGSLGAYLIDTMINSPKVAHIFALNRATDGKAKQTQSNTSRKLTTDFSKVTFLHASMGDKNFGLKQEDYDKIKSSAHCIIHNGWQVDFNLSLASFEPHIRGVKNLIDMSLASELHPYIILTSTVSGVGSYFHINPDDEMVPEEVFDNLGVALPMGYAIGKQISEKMLDVAAKRTGLRTCTARIGQVSGPAERLGGIWNKQEWLPSLVVSSAYLKKLPGKASCIDWTPVDLLAEILVEISLHDSANTAPYEKSAVYNLANKNIVEWDQMVPTIMKYMPADTETVSMQEWIAALKQSAQEDQVNVAENPAVKLAEFFEGSGEGNVEWGKKLRIENAAKSSSVMRNLVPVKSEWMEYWMKGWGLSKRN